VTAPLFTEEAVSRYGWRRGITMESPVLPCVDVDGPLRAVPLGSFRCYATRKGHRVFYTGLVQPVDENIVGIFRQIGADEKFLHLCLNLKRYCMRVSPKQQEELLPRQAICRLHGQRGPIRPEWEAFLARHDELCLRPDALVLV